MSSVSDYSLANQGFSAFRTELNNILGAINTHNLATSAPSSLAEVYGLIVHQQEHTHLNIMMGQIV